MRSLVLELSNLFPELTILAGVTSELSKLSPEFAPEPTYGRGRVRPRIEHGALLGCLGRLEPRFRAPRGHRRRVGRRRQGA